MASIAMIDSAKRNEWAKRRKSVGVVAGRSFVNFPLRFDFYLLKSVDKNLWQTDMLAASG